MAVNYDELSTDELINKISNPKPDTPDAPDYNSLSTDDLISRISGEPSDSGVLPSKIVAPKRGIAGDVVSHLARGVEHGAGLLGGTLEMLDAKTTETPEEEGFLDRTGRRMRQWSERPAEEKASVFLPSADEVTQKESWGKGQVMKGVQSLPTSVMPGLAGMGAGAFAGFSVGGPPGAIIGGIVGGVGSAAATAGMFGLGTYRQKKLEYDQKAPHLGEEERHNLAKEYAKAEAIPELVSGMISPFIFLSTGGAGGVAGKEAVKQGVKELLKLTPKMFAKNMAKSYAVEVGSETYTAKRQSQLDSTAYGTPEMSYLEALGEVAIPTAVMTLTFGLGGTTIDIASKRKALADLNSEDMQTRVDALKDTARRIEDKEIRQAWLDFGSRAITSGKQIDIQADFTVRQPDETSVLPTNPVDMTAPKTVPPPPPGAAPVVGPEESVIPKTVDLMAPKDLAKEPVSPAETVLPVQALPQPDEAILPQTEGQVIPDGQEGTKDANANAEGQGQGQKGLLSVVPEQNAADQPSVEPVTGPSAVEAAPAAKAQWQMTKKEFIDDYSAGIPENAGPKSRMNILKDFEVNHRAIVEQALSEGKITSHPDYPDLQPPQSRILTPEEQEELGVTYIGEQDTPTVEAAYSAYTDNETGSTFIVENRGDIAPTVEKMRKSFKDAEGVSAPSVVPETSTPETSVVPETPEAAVPVIKAEPEAKEQKEPWQMTKKEYGQRIFNQDNERFKESTGKERQPLSFDKMADSPEGKVIQGNHRDRVEKAISEGKITSHPDYPDLAPANVTETAEPNISEPVSKETEPILPKGMKANMSLHSYTERLKKEGRTTIHEKDIDFNHILDFKRSFVKGNIGKKKIIEALRGKGITVETGRRKTIPKEEAKTETVAAPKAEDSVAPEVTEEPKTEDEEVATEKKAKQQANNDNLKTEEKKTEGKNKTIVSDFDKDHIRFIRDRINQGIAGFSHGAYEEGGTLQVSGKCNPRKYISTEKQRYNDLNNGA